MKTEKKSKNAAFSGLIAAIAASSCCIPPVIALIAGIGGSASALAWMEPFRPYLIGFAVIAIGYAWYNYLKPKKTDDCDCEMEKPKFYQTKGFLIAISLFAAISICFPYYAHTFYLDNKKDVVAVSESNISEVEYKIKGMTCLGCQAHIENEVNKLDGIIDVNADYEKENAVVIYDKTKVTVKEVENAILKTGYKIVK